LFVFFVFCCIIVAILALKTTAIQAVTTVSFFKKLGVFL